MAKTAGFPAKIQITDSGSVARDLSNDLTDFTLNTSRGEQSITGLDKSAMERLLLLADVKFTAKGVYNSAANKSHAVFTGLIQAAVASSTIIDLPPATSGAPRLTVSLVWSEFSYNRGANSELTFSVTGSLSDGTVPTWSTVP